MKHFRICALLFVALAMIQAAPKSPEPDIYVAATPCYPISRHYLGIPADSECDFIKWKLALKKDPRNAEPTFFQLEYAYGKELSGTQGFTNTRTKNLEGNYKKGEMNGRKAFILEKGKGSIPLARLSENLLHLLDEQGKLMVGDGGFSYTLNRQNL